MYKIELEKLKTERSNGYIRLGIFVYSHFLYKRLRNTHDNFNDIQGSGDFYYSQKVIELSEGSRYKQYFEKLIDNISFTFGGFGERPFVPLLWIIIFIISFSLYFSPNKDFYLNDKTPQYLYTEKTMNYENNYDELELCPSSSFYFSLNSLKSPFGIQQFIIKDINVSVLYMIESVILRYLIGAFLLAIKN